MGYYNIKEQNYEWMSRPIFLEIGIRLVFFSSLMLTNFLQYVFITIMLNKIFVLTTHKRNFIVNM